MPHTEDLSRPLALVTGATGYIGGRLVPELLAGGYQVRVLVRHPERVASKPWASEVEVVAGDAREAGAMYEALRGVDVAYFLLHSLSTDPSFEDEELLIAHNFAEAAAKSGVSRIVYLGGIVDPKDADLSPHLRSRQRVGEVLQSSGVPTVELRAAVILGSGSASFEMLRYLAERLPVMTTPKWVRSRIQPIAVRDVLHYLVRAAALPSDISRTFDIGGPDILTYEDMMKRYAKVAGLPKPLIFPVPVLSPGLSSHWVGLITPVPPSIARPLVESLKHEVVCTENDVRQFIPDPDNGLLTFEEACAKALARIKDVSVATRWSEASVTNAPSDPWPGDPQWSGGSLYTDKRTAIIDASRECVWGVLQGIGGDRGWYSWPLAWRTRGVIDRSVGGVGLARGRKHPDELYVGDTVDFWRVEECKPPMLLRLRAEMKMPGAGWLEFHLESTDAGRTGITQKAVFHPRGLAGHAYWKAMQAFHGVVFGQMLSRIGQVAQASQTTSPSES
jgi:uncharacterized protein YbjT (DUF2867 family)